MRPGGEDRNRSVAPKENGLDLALVVKQARGCQHPNIGIHREVGVPGTVRVRESDPGVEHVFRLAYQVEYRFVKRIEPAYFGGIERTHAFQQVLGVDRIDDPSSQG
jgi:hypothetical protein